MDSLAEIFVKNPESKGEYREANAPSKDIRNYILAADLIKENINCASYNNCEWFHANDEERASEELQNYACCITCDQLYHLRCAGIDFSELKEEKLPWLCYKCMTNPMNEEAQKLVQDKKHLQSFTDRIRFFVKSSAFDEPPKTQEAAIPKSSDSVLESSQEEYNGTLHVDSKGRVLPNYMQTFKLMQNKVEKTLTENVMLREQMFEQNKQMISFMQQSIEMLSQQNERDVHKLTSINDEYTAAILNKNASSTRIESNTSNINNLTRTFSPIIDRKPDRSNNQNVADETSIINSTARHLSQLALNETRKCLPKIETFDGKPEKWLTFQRAVERNWREGQYSDEMMKLIIRQALAGQALQRVDSLIDLMTAKEIMQFLKDSYGNSNIVVDNARQKLLNVRLSKPLTHASCVEVTTLIAGYMSACSYAGLLVADTTISSKIHNQLEPFHQQMYYEFFFKKHPNASMRVERLDIQFEFLNNLAKTLPIGQFKDEKSSKAKAQYQVMVASIGETSNSVKSYSYKSSPASGEAYKFEIRDNTIAKYLGYDMMKVQELNRHCEICSRNNHYTVECRNYRDMKIDARYNVAKTKNLCLNCMITTGHNAKDCEIKLGCGYKLDKNTRCTAKHHISLHRNNVSNINQVSNKKVYEKQRRRARSNHNAAKAKDRIKQSSNNSNSGQVLQHQVTENEVSVSNQQQTQQNSQIPQGYPVQAPTAVSTVSQAKQRVYQMFTVKTQVYPVSESSPRTIKIFKTIFYGKKGRALGYSVGDSGSEITLVKKELIDDLGISGEYCMLDLQWTDSVIKRTEAIKVKLPISGVLPDSKMIELDEVYAVNDLNLAARTLNVEALKKQFSYLKAIPFDSYEDAIPAMLIGSRHAYIMEATEPVIHGGSNFPIAIKSLLGYSIYGGAPECFKSKYEINIHQQPADEIENADENQSQNNQLEQLYTYACSLESLGIKPKQNHLTKDEKKAIEILEDEMKTLEDGSVETPLIWNRNDKREIPKLPNNFPMVYKRQVAHENKLKKRPELLEAFNKNFMELISEGYVRSATERDIKSEWPNVWYLPMSLVVNENKIPIKTRNVYDASAIYQGVSLNQALLMGPNLLVDMLCPLMRFRMFKYAVTGDVKSMFHRIKICERDQQVQRILWRENQEKSLQVYIQQVMLFGPKCSPFTSQFVKNKTADKWQCKYPNAVKALKEYTYMDDLLSSEPTIEEAIAVSTQSIEILKSINWQLVGFQSNSAEVLKALSENNVKQEVISIMSTEESSYTTKVLGVAWNPKIDAFMFQFNKNEFIKLVKDCGVKPTKRDQCSTIARIFDVLGLISHCIIRGKILLQRSWKKKIGWDDEIADEEHKIWLQWLNDLEKVSSLKIPRLRFVNHNFTDAEKIELHTFCDAGKEAFAAVSYFVVTINGYRYVSLIMSKAKVAPIKIKTKTEVSEMPRLELLSCLIGARLADTIKNLHKGYEMEIHFWSDNEIGLNWLKKDNIKLPKFAISPIEEILELSDQNQWHYVDTKNNVADIATKFQRFDFSDINSSWFQGPEFLKLPKEHWPMQKLPTKLSKAFIGCVNQEAMLINEPIKLPPIDCPLASDFMIDMYSAGITSRWPKLVRAVGRTLKLYYDVIIPLIKAKQWTDAKALKIVKQNNNFVSLSPMELERAELFIIRRMQREIYGPDYEKLRQNKRIHNKELLQLDVFLDQNGIIRISSRVNLPKPNYAQKFAPVVPRKSSLANTLLFNYHYKHRHVGLEAQVAEFNARFWMPGVRQALKNIKSMCNYCGLMRAKPIEYKMSPLPNVRIDTELKPFEVTGLDCAGPFVIYAKNGHAKKVWILIFTCTRTRFIHLHLLDNMSSLSVLEAIKILWTAHGPISTFISDNGTNFVGAANIIMNDRHKILAALREVQKDIESKLAEKTFATWKFIPVSSPWFGAFYERLIQVVKKSIATAIEKKRITRTEFNIALQEAAHRINCRPLTHIPIDKEDEEILTPHHLVKLRSGWPLLPSIHGMKHISDPLSDKDQYRKGLILADELARKFTAYYLPVLTKRTKWFKNFAPIKTGDLVLIIDPSKTRKAWERARIIKIYKSKDNNARVVDLKLADDTVRKKRSVKHLAKIDIKTL